MYERLLTL